MEMGTTCIYLAISSVLLFNESYCLSFSLNILDNNTIAEHTPYGKNEISVMILLVNERKEVLIRHKYNNHTEAYLLLYGCVSSAFRLKASLKSLFLDCPSECLGIRRTFTSFHFILSSSYSENYPQAMFQTPQG